MQPATITRESPPATLGISSMSKIISRLSSVAAWMNEQVLTMIASAEAGSSTILTPAASRRSLIFAESTSFFAQPIVMMCARIEVDDGSTMTS